ncbi:MAG: nitroreductase [Candidatus Aminicenantes bacterium RBG_13_63_10]|nr:MAG: nitroreductase [Candidatus Aminicenantes bacterium RBG_13_63_10]
MSEWRTLFLKRRSVRRFLPRRPPREILMSLVEAARLAPSAANRQPLEFILADEPEVCKLLFPSLRWAAYISPHGDPPPGQEPTAYIVTLVNTGIREKGYEYDVGAAMMSMTLAAWAEGVAGCWVISVDKAEVRRLLDVPETHLIDSVLALGYPAETPVVEDLNDSVRYWKDPEGRLHVPKRRLDSIVHFNRF